MLEVWFLESTMQKENETSNFLMDSYFTFFCSKCKNVLSLLFNSSVKREVVAIKLITKWPRPNLPLGNLWGKFLHFLRTPNFSKRCNCRKFEIFQFSQNTKVFVVTLDVVNNSVEIFCIIYYIDVNISGFIFKD